MAQNVTGFNFVNYFSRNADNIIIGAFLDQTLGYYAKAYSLMLLPLRQLNAPFYAVAFPLLSRLSHDPGLYRTAYTRLTQNLLLLTTPIAIIGLLCGRPIISLFLGKEWAPAGDIFSWLSINCLIQPLYSSIGWLFLSQDRTRELLRWGVFSSFAIVASFFAGIPFGAVGVAIAYTASMLMLGPILFTYVGKRGPVSARNLFNLTGQSAMHAATMLAVAAPAIYCLNILGKPISIPVGFAGCIIGTVLYLCLSRRTRQVLDDITYIGMQVLCRPQSINPSIESKC